MKSKLFFSVLILAIFAFTGCSTAVAYPNPFNSEIGINGFTNSPACTTISPPTLDKATSNYPNIVNSVPIANTPATMVDTTEGNTVILPSKPPGIQNQETSVYIDCNSDLGSSGQLPAGDSNFSPPSGDRFAVVCNKPIG